MSSDCGILSCLYGSHLAYILKYTKDIPVCALFMTYIFDKKFISIGSYLKDHIVRISLLTYL